MLRAQFEKKIRSHLIGVYVSKCALCQESRSFPTSPISEIGRMACRLEIDATGHIGHNARSAWENDIGMDNYCPDGSVQLGILGTTREARGKMILGWIVTPLMARCNWV